MERKLIVIGGGASGLMAAITAAKYGAKVIVLEHKDRVGKKILMTGNGKCNLTNMSNPEGKYYSDNLDFVYQILDQFTASDTRHFFADAGLYTKEKRDGGVYPVSEQAASVLDLLRMECERLHVSVLTDFQVSDIIPNINGGKVVGFTENHRKNTLEYDRLILATGSKAAPVSGSDGSGYQIVKKMGHTVIEPLPALVQLKCKGDYFKSVSGVRCQAGIDLYINQKYSASQEGELQITDYGISGIPTFQLSRMVSRALSEQKSCQVHIDFLTYLSEDEKKNVWKTYKKFPYKTLEEWLFGFTHKKIASLICKLLHCKGNTKLQNIEPELARECIHLLTDFVVDVSQTNSFEQCQVCCGGVSLLEIKPTLESKKVRNVYIVGELLDCDGICGGYNLQWAWATGAIAGKHAAID